MRNIIILSLLVTLFACETPKHQESADDVMQKETEQSMKEAQRETGYPAITRFQEKKQMKMIYELRDQENLICYAYLVNTMNGKVGQFLGKTVGYGLPYSTQFSNPQKLGTTDGGQYGAENPYTMPQPEPNGLFMPEGLSATWLLMVDPKTGNPRPVYVEPEIIVSPFPLH
jgi:hypothetical protein